MNRRHFLATTDLAAGTTALPATTPVTTPNPKHPILLSLKYGMCRDGKTPAEKFQLLKELGDDGVELNSPGGGDKKEALANMRRHLLGA